MSRSTSLYVTHQQYTVCRILTIPPLDVMFGFDEHPQPVHLLPLQLVQLCPKIVVDKVQLFGKFALLQAQNQQTTAQYTFFF